MALKLNGSFPMCHERWSVKARFGFLFIHTLWKKWEFFIQRKESFFLHISSLEMYFHRMKHVSLHQQDKKVFILPNTPRDFIDVPAGYNVCKTIDSFKIKSLKGGFQRRPELIAQYEVNDQSIIHPFPKSKTVQIQLELAEKALHLLDTFLLPQTLERYSYECEGLQSPKFALDIGCGSGLSMVPLINRSYHCVGADLNKQSLAGLKQKECENHFSCPSQSHWLNTFSCYKNVHFSGTYDVVRWDLRHGLPFRNDVFDLSISISFLQWLFYGHRSQQLNAFFSSLHRVLCPGGRCAIQFYPRNPKQLYDAINHASLYFKGAVVGDYPHIDRGRKLFLLLTN